jgi:hypothetical protein
LCFDNYISTSHQLPLQKTIELLTRINLMWLIWSERAFSGQHGYCKKLIKIRVKKAPFLKKTLIIPQTVLSIIINNECYFTSMSDCSDKTLTEINKLLFWKNKWTYRRPLLRLFIGMIKSTQYFGLSVHCLAVLWHLKLQYAGLIKYLIISWFWMKALWFSI